jgi:drug/metabolite transporter (DMT)-like permease
VLAVGGLACVVEVWAGLRLDALGLLLALGAACCQVGYFLLSDQGEGPGKPEGTAAPSAAPLGVIAYGLLVGAVVLTFVARPWGMDWSVLGGRAEMDGTPVAAFLLLAWIVLLATVVAYATGVVSVRSLSPQVAVVVACVEAVVATVLAWVLLGEHLSPPQLAGGCVVLVGAFVAQTASPSGPGEPRAVAEGGALPGERREEVPDAR